MTTSRRGFLQYVGGSVGATVAAGITMPWPKAWAAGAAHAAILEPPRPAEDDGFIRLNSNENAYGPSAKVADAIKAAVSRSNRYPYMDYDSLRDRIAGSHNVQPEQVVLGCGSTEILRVAACAFLGNGKQLIQASPTFESMQHYARAVGSDVISVHLTPKFWHDLDAMLARASATTTLVYICNPNNPTASLTPRKDLEAFIAKLPASTVVLIDEAYHHFAGPSGNYASFIDQPIHDDRVVVTRTFSKVYALAGLRIGYGIASPKLAAQMRKFTTEDNLNAIAIQAAMAGLDDTDGLNHSIDRNANDRQEFFNQAMARMLKPIDSHANFVMMNAFHPTEEVIHLFHKNNVLIGRPFPPMDTYIRVSLGLPDEMVAFWQAWDKLPYSKDLMSH
jgi:histidinol-phosphate aminotransferase